MAGTDRSMGVYVLRTSVEGFTHIHTQAHAHTHALKVRRPNVKGAETSKNRKQRLPQAGGGKAGGQGRRDTYFYIIHFYTF